MRNLTLRQIRIFMQAAKQKSFSRAAEELHITAPAVSLQIKEMEENMGVSLFSRENRKTEMTSAGEYFFLYARRVLNTLDEASIMMERLRGSTAGALKIGMVSTAQYFFPQILVKFKAECPNVQIFVEIRNRQQLVELLHNGDIDIAIMGQPPKDIDTRVEPFANHPHAFIASPRIPLADKTNISPQVLNKFELIIREPGSGTRIIMEKFLNDHSLSPIVGMVMSSNEAIKQAVMADLGISFVSLHTVGEEVNRGRLVILDVEGTPIARSWHAVALNKRHVSQAAETFRYFMLEKGSEIINEMFNV